MTEPLSHACMHTSCSFLTSHCYHAYVWQYGMFRENDPINLITFIMMLPHGDLCSIPLLVKGLAHDYQYLMATC